MSVVNQINITNIKDIKTLIQFLQPFCAQVSVALNNGLSFKDNIQASIVTTSFSLANTSYRITHGLPSTPIGYIAIRLSSGNVNLYDGSSPVLGPTFANIKSSQQMPSATILFF